MTQFRNIKGTHDLLPKDLINRQKIEFQIHQWFIKFKSNYTKWNIR